MKDIVKQKNERRERRRAKIRILIRGTAERPRLAVKRSLKHIYAQLIDDVAGRTLLTASDLKIGKKDLNKKSLAREVGREAAKLAAKAGIKEIVFDRAGYKYHGRVRELAEGAREGGLKF